MPSLYNLIFGTRGGMAVPAADGVGTVNVPAVIAVDSTGNPLSLGGSGAAAQQVQGNVADYVADFGNSVKFGGIYQPSPTVAATGQRISVWLNARGAMMLAAGASGGTSDGAAAAAALVQDAGGTQRPLGTMNYLISPSNGTFRQPGDSSGAFNAGSSFWTESATAQTGSATLNGGARSSGGTPAGIGSRFNMFVAEAFADQTGTLYIDKSLDGTTWRQVGSIAAVVGTSVSLKVPVSAANYRARYVNGATAQGAFLLTTAFTAS